MILLPTLKRRIRIIFWLMTLCIAGINGFQAYWLYTTWQLTRQQFGRDAREALFVVGQREDQAFAVFFRRELKNRSSLAGPAVRTFTIDTRQRSAKPRRQAPRADTATRRSQTHPTNKGRAVRLLDEAVLTALINHWPISLSRLSQTYRQELQLRGIAADFRLDTLRLDATQQAQLSDAGTASITLYLPQYGPATTTAPASAAEQPQAAAQPKQRAVMPGAVQTPPVPLLPVRELYVQATFPTPTFYILRRMGSLLAGSALLAVLTTGCFALMLSTILRQKKLSEVKNDFINNMTHELKTPLATVAAAVEALQHFGALHDPHKTQSYLRIAQREVERLSGLVEKVLHMAVAEREVLTLHLEPVSLAELVHEQAARHQLHAPKPVQFTLDVPAGAARLDRLHVGNVLNNLIDNAIKYSREQVTVAIRGWRADSGWRLIVQDDGIGIPKSHQQAIFDRFFRVPTGDLHPVKGFGLGLYYVRQVVERHGGRIEVCSEPGRGTEFTLWLPG